MLRAALRRSSVDLNNQLFSWAWLHSPLYCCAKVDRKLKSLSCFDYSPFKIPKRNLRVSTFSRTSEIKDQLSFSKSSALCKYVQSLLEEHQRIAERLNTSKTSSDSEAASLRLAYLAPIVACHRKIDKNNQELEETRSLLTDSSISDNEIHAMVKMDAARYEQIICELEQELLRLLMPAEPFDNLDINLEVTAGVGGVEAMLFAKRLFDMYQSYVCFKGWDGRVIQCENAELDGLRHGSLYVSGFGAYSYLKFEGGVHRVQRVPQTEKSGRIHTSTVAVAILPQPNEIEADIKPKDLKMETKRASGAGGQHVNKTDSAVRLIHIPSGIIVESQSERSQVQNKSIALRRLRAKLYQRKYEEELEKRQAARRIQVGTSGRSEKIRTYNFVQDRITDHRLVTNFQRVHDYLTGGASLDHVIQRLIRESQQEILAEIISK